MLDAMSSLTEFLFPAPAPRSTGAILAWWEKRRPAFNFMVGSAGLVTLGAVHTVLWMQPGPMQWVPWQPIVVYGVLANLCYFLGPLVEVSVHRLWERQVLPLGPSLFRMGLTFSIGLTLLPILVLVIFSIVKIVFSLV